jgi:hypothetical protein
MLILEPLGLEGKYASQRPIPGDSQRVQVIRKTEHVALLEVVQMFPLEAQSLGAAIGRRARRELRAGERGSPLVVAHAQIHQYQPPILANE